ncbi:hypothetical protein ACOQFV_03130 [Nocardiopsis changdeensis]|uniref:Uncharacterized protein n=1 Tax=Nocardiopsis changdeensis TaxID=2831969 RepID=A0ABX8BKM0_9ACTN|nr:MULTISPECIES: hypothetical protein [Nocardiopsis]QUX22614.1 hypothetical protein KGD84_30700 [Nocardiopsis changdeensis]QYX38556.1 hypothetical protein K1J57_08080 [Nocardiopsis sp. MT53]
MKFEVVEPEDQDEAPEGEDAQAAAGPPAPADPGTGEPASDDPARHRIERIAERTNSQVKADIATARAALGKLWSTIAEKDPLESDSRHIEPLDDAEPPPIFRPSAFSPAPRPPADDGGGPGGDHAARP